MGSACCVATRDKTISTGANSEILRRGVQHSPSWTIRWDNRGRVAGEDTSLSGSSDGIPRADRLEDKSEMAIGTISEAASLLQNFQPPVLERSPLSDRSTIRLRTPGSDLSISSSISMDVGLDQAKEAIDFPAGSDEYVPKLSPVVPSTSFSTSPLSSNNHVVWASLTPVTLPGRASGSHLIRQLFESNTSGANSPGSFSFGERRSPVSRGWRNESSRGSHGGSSDGGSMSGFPEFLPSYRGRWSFDSDSLGFSQDKITRSSSPVSYSVSIIPQTCGVCLKLLAEKSLFGSQKIISSNELSVVAVLTCGHVYHAECLENMTPEFHKYDPGCPICTFGEQKALKLSKKALKEQMEMKAKNSKRSRNRMVDSDLGEDFISLDHGKGHMHDRKSSKMTSSSSRKSSFTTPFLKRHFSLGTKSSKSLLENHPPVKKRGFFWSKSIK